MDSKEMGLVLAQNILDLKDLHYGFWDEDTKVCVEISFELKKNIQPFF